ncbi:MAG: hypothetical protein LQ340_007678, partial [Diploschistes diacapsis]
LNGRLVPQENDIAMPEPLCETPDLGNMYHERAQQIMGSERQTSGAGMSPDIEGLERSLAILSTAPQGHAEGQPQPSRSSTHHMPLGDSLGRSLDTVSRLNQKKLLSPLNQRQILSTFGQEKILSLLSERMSIFESSDFVQYLEDRNIDRAALAHVFDHMKGQVQQHSFSKAEQLGLDSDLAVYIYGDSGQVFERVYHTCKNACPLRDESFDVDALLKRFLAQANLDPGTFDENISVFQKQHSVNKLGTFVKGCLRRLCIDQDYHIQHFTGLSEHVLNGDASDRVAGTAGNAVARVCCNHWLKKAQDRSELRLVAYVANTRLLDLSKYCLFYFNNNIRRLSQGHQTTDVCSFSAGKEREESCARVGKDTTDMTPQLDIKATKHPKRRRQGQMDRKLQRYLDLVSLEEPAATKAARRALNMAVKHLTKSGHFDNHQINQAAQRRRDNNGKQGSGTGGGPTRQQHQRHNSKTLAGARIAREMKDKGQRKVLVSSDLVSAMNSTSLDGSAMKPEEVVSQSIEDGASDEEMGDADFMPFVPRVKAHDFNAICK